MEYNIDASRSALQVRQAFAYYEAEDTWRALFDTMDLFRWLERETAEKPG